MVKKLNNIVLPGIKIEEVRLLSGGDDPDGWNKRSEFIIQIPNN